ncbi:hypothetical protein ISF26_18735 [Gloeobacter morelensis MG652769]|uniref:Uncharacterized protein n=2 Tax=Gloeobacter TaxID=33071 RepID=A0ABY3PJI7_9CYAN|nr:hypothetical protein ISF26_18735 [Gloeobacter morelensis MG652769]
MLTHVNLWSGMGMQKYMRRCATSLTAAAAAAVMTFAGASAEAQTAAEGTTASVEPLGLVDVRDLPTPRERTQVRVIRRPLARFPEPAVKPLAASDAVLGAADAVEPASEAAANLIESFEGISASGIEPPDPHIAVGPSDVLLATNAALRVYSKSGSPLSGLIDPSSFFLVPPQFEIQSDPKVLYDARSGRFFAVWIAFDQQANVGAWFVAVSTSSSANGTYFVYQVTENGNLPDYPGLGVCNDKLVITANDFRLLGGFTFVYNGAVAVALNKSQLTAGATTSFNRFGNIQLSGGAGQAFTIQPVHSLTGTNTCNMVTLRGNNGIQLYKIGGLPPSATLTTVSTVPALPAPVSTPPDAVQQGTSVRIDTLDTRLLDATLRGANGGSIWTASTTGCRFSGSSTTFACINVVEIANVSTTPTLRQQIVFGAPGSYYYIPALRTDSTNNMTVVFGRSSSSEFPSARYTSRLNSAPLGVLESSKLLVSGSAPYTGTRWGDYFGAALGPDNRSIWIYGEYKRTGSGFWQTFVGQTQVP